MSAVVVKLATNRDRETLCRLYHEFHEFHVRGVPDRLLSLGEPLDTYEQSDLYQTLARIIQGADSAIFVAKVAGQLIGLAEVYVRQDESNPLKLAYRHGHLQSLMVKEAFRGQGIGEKLLEAAEKWAKARGAIEMRVETWEFEGGPLRFYEKNDYRTLRRTLVRVL